MVRLLLDQLDWADGIESRAVVQYEHTGICSSTVLSMCPPLIGQKSGGG